MKATIRKANGDVIEVEGTAAEIAEILATEGHKTLPSTPVPGWPLTPIAPAPWVPNPWGTGPHWWDSPYRFNLDLPVTICHQQ
jgi:hypothetical protein